MFSLAQKLGYYLLLLCGYYLLLVHAVTAVDAPAPVPSAQSSASCFCGCLKAAGEGLAKFMEPSPIDPDAHLKERLRETMTASTSPYFVHSTRKAGEILKKAIDGTAGADLSTAFFRNLSVSDLPTKVFNYKPARTLTTSVAPPLTLLVFRREKCRTYVGTSDHNILKTNDVRNCGRSGLDRYGEGAATPAQRRALQDRWLLAALEYFQVEEARRAREECGYHVGREDIIQTLREMSSRPPVANEDFANKVVAERLLEKVQGSEVATLDHDEHFAGAGVVEYVRATDHMGGGGISEFIVDCGLEALEGIAVPQGSRSNFKIPEEVSSRLPGGLKLFTVKMSGDTATEVLEKQEWEDA